MAREERGKRPFKIWDSWRNIRKSLVVNSLKDLELRGREKLQIPSGETVRLVLESDGTQVEDGEYFRTLPNNTVILLLRNNERWYPTGVDVIRTAISAIPKIVCETIHALELQDETPSWKIMDNKGRVTVVLHWDQRQVGGGGGGSGKTSALPGSSEAGTAASSGTATPKKQSSLVIQTSVDGSGRKETLINDVYPARYTASPQITVINHDDPDRVGPIWTTSGHPRLTKQGSSFESATAIHVHTPECIDHSHRPAGTSSRAGSPSNNASECDFHCCALHEEGRKIAVHKSVATSPIQDSLSTSPQQHPSSISDGSRRAAGMPPKGHVRFLDVEGCSNSRQHPSTTSGSIRPGGPQSTSHQHDSSESETENTVIEEEAVTTEKFLLLIDQLSVDQKRHLTIKDIGIILERLSSKILDVERLDRESEGEDCYNWTIKATIRGDVLRELGVIYNGNYYAISEHPGYKEESEEAHDDEEEVEEEDDRL